MNLIDAISHRTPYNAVPQHILRAWEQEEYHDARMRGRELARERYELEDQISELEQRLWASDSDSGVTFVPMASEGRRNAFVKLFAAQHRLRELNVEDDQRQLFILRRNRERFQRLERLAGARGHVV